VNTHAVSLRRVMTRLVKAGLVAAREGRPTAFYDLFRVAQGKIAEHWDTLETIPPRDRWHNPNGTFGF
jgi:predicted SnoaL-like aldol condensation-catalyzing enzyme